MHDAPTDDLVPLAERLRLLWVLRAAAVLAALVAWQLVPATRGTSFEVLAKASCGFLAVLGVLHVGWRVVGRRGLGLLSVMLILDSVFLVWVTYGTAGPDTPLRALVLVQIVTVSLLASFKTGMKLTVWNSLLVLAVFHAGEFLPDGALGAAPARFGDDAYRQLTMDIAFWWALAVATCSFAAVNERELRRRRFDLESLAVLAMDLDRIARPADVAAALVRRVQDTFDYRDVAVVAAPRGRPELLAPAATGEDALASPLVERVLADGRRRLAADVGADALLRSALRDTRNVLLLPLRAEGRAIGVLAVGHALRRESRVQRRVVQMLERYASQTALALANSWLLEQSEQRADTDALTGLPNRRRLDNALGRMAADTARTGRVVTVLLVDLDHFKAINDTHGHGVGDDVLRVAAQALAAEVRGMDLAARYGGEEFCVLLPALEGHEAAAAAERLRAALEASGAPVPITASLGVATLRTGDTGPGAVLEAADAALYRAKRAGRNRVELDASVLDAVR